MESGPLDEQKALQSVVLYEIASMYARQGSFEGKAVELAQYLHLDITFAWECRNFSSLRSHGE